MTLLQRINEIAAALVTRGVTPTRLEVTGGDWEVLFDELRLSLTPRGGLTPVREPLEAMGHVRLVLDHCGPVHVAPAREGYSALCWPDRSPGRLVVHGWNRERIQ